METGATLSLSLRCVEGSGGRTRWEKGRQLKVISSQQQSAIARHKLKATEKKKENVGKRFRSLFSSPIASQRPLEGEGERERVDAV